MDEQTRSPVRTRAIGPAPEDWSDAYVGYRLKLAGWTFSKLSRHHGYKSRSTMLNPLNRRWPKGERLLATAIGVTPQEIWPSRYKQACPAILDRSLTDDTSATPSQVAQHEARRCPEPEFGK